MLFKVKTETVEMLLTFTLFRSAFKSNIALVFKMISKSVSLPA